MLKLHMLGANGGLPGVPGVPLYEGRDPDSNVSDDERRGVDERSTLTRAPDARLSV